MSKRQPLIAGNWKMHKTQAEARALAREIRQGLPPGARAEVLVAPPFTALNAVAGELSGSSIRLGAQDTFWERQGAYTGAISPVMLADAGCHYVIVGHSERRQLFGDTNQDVNRKLLAVLEAGPAPILCIGETLAERQAEETLHVVAAQLHEGLAGLPGEARERVVIAYEPVWAIGTGQTATPKQAQEVQAFIRKIVGEIFSSPMAQGVRILYGGSVKPENIGELMAMNDVDGALVGGASLEVKSFAKIIRGCISR